jgi:uncharacterized Zn finger protein (UPF0148 family)
MACELCGYEGEPIPIWDKNEREQKKILCSVVIRDGQGRIVNAVNCICPVCGLVYIIPKMDRARCKEFYEREYRETYELQEDSEERHATVAFDYLYYKKAINIPFLDIGASTGKLVEKIQKLTKVEAYGIDSAQQNEFVEQVDIEDYEPKIKFRCVTMLNTLEHMYSPVTILKKVYNIMADKSVLLVSVPDLLNTNIQRPTDAYLSNAHLYTFSQYTLHNMLIKCGFTPLEIATFPEEIGNKMYALCIRTQPQEPEYRKINPEALKRFLNAANVVFIEKYFMLKG